MIPKLTPDLFFYLSLICAIIVIIVFFCYKKKNLSHGDIVSVITIFLSCFGVIYSSQIWYIILDKHGLGDLEDQKISILAGSIATIWVAVLAIIQSFKK